MRVLNSGPSWPLPCVEWAKLPLTRYPEVFGNQLMICQNRCFFRERQRQPESNNGNVVIGFWVIASEKSQQQQELVSLNTNSWHFHFTLCDFRSLPIVPELFVCVVSCVRTAALADAAYPIDGVIDHIIKLNISFAQSSSVNQNVHTSHQWSRWYHSEFIQMNRSLVQLFSVCIWVSALIFRHDMSICVNFQSYMSLRPPVPIWCPFMWNKLVVIPKFPPFWNYQLYIWSRPGKAVRLHCRHLPWNPI